MPRTSPRNPAFALACVLSVTCGVPASAQDSTVCIPESFAVAVDVGHTAAAPGATSARGVPEYSFNRFLAAAVLQNLVDAGFVRSFLVWDGDGVRRLEDRPRIARERGAKLFVSIHHDSVQPRYLSSWQVDGNRQSYSDRFSGFAVFYSAGSARPSESEYLASALGLALVYAGFTPSTHHAEMIPGEGRPTINQKIGLYRYDGLVVLREAAMPALLLEAGVIVHRDEELLMVDPQVARRQAAAVVRAVRMVCGTQQRR